MWSARLWMTICSAAITSVIVFWPLLVCNDGTRSGTRAGAYESTFFASDQAADDRAARRTAADINQLAVTTVVIWLFVIVLRRRAMTSIPASLSRGRGRKCY